MAGCLDPLGSINATCLMHPNAFLSTMTTKESRRALHLTRHLPNVAGLVPNVLSNNDDSDTIVTNEG